MLQKTGAGDPVEGENNEDRGDHRNSQGCSREFFQPCLHMRTIVHSCRLIQVKVMRQLCGASRAVPGGSLSARV